MCSGSRFSARYCDPQTTEKNTAKKGGRLKLGSLKLNTQGKKNPKKKKNGNIPGLLICFPLLPLFATKLVSK